MGALAETVTVRAAVRWFLVSLCFAGAARAETPTWTLGPHVALRTNMHPPPWLVTGGHLRLRVASRVSLGFDGDGWTGDTASGLDVVAWEYRRSLLTYTLGAAFHPWTTRTIDTRLGAGFGVGFEQESSRAPAAGIDDWLSDDSSWRPVVFVGAAFEHRWPVREPFSGGRAWLGFGIEARGSGLFGDGPMSPAPALDRYAAQLTLEVSAYQ